MRALIALVLVSACGVDVSWVVTPEVSDGSSVALWSARVGSAVAHWQSAIGDDCRFPIEVGPNGTPIDLVEPAAIPYLGLTTHGAEQLDIEAIQIRSGMSPLDTHAVIMHEMGHAIGLGHEVDDDSIMRSPIGAGSPSSRDVAHARAALGCHG